MNKKLLHYLAVPANVVANNKDWLSLLEVDNINYSNVEIYNVSELDNEIFTHIFDLIFSNFNSREKVWRTIRHAEYIALISDYDSESYVACALLCGETIRSIEYVCVHEQHRGNRLATYMVKNLIDYTYQYLSDAPHLTLVSKPELRSLYEGCGFTCVAESE